MNDEKIIWDKLIAAGMTPCGAAGSMGNQKAESGLDPQSLQNSFEKKLGYTDAAYTAPPARKSGLGMGRATMTSTRRKEMMKPWRTWIMW